MAFPCCLLVAYIPLNDTSQSDRQFREIGDVQKGITVYTLNVLLISSNGRRNEQKPLALILMLDTTQILLCSSASVSSFALLHGQGDLITTKS